MTTREVVRSGHRPNDPDTSKSSCTTEGCVNIGGRYIEGRYVCDTCRSRHYRKGKKVCNVEGCHGFVKFGAKQARRYCREHEQGYLLDQPRLVTSTLAELPEHLTVHADGCWQYKSFWGESSPRATFTRGGMQWLVYRYLYVWFYGGHHARYELHHRCLHRWCVRPEHLTPITPTMNQSLESEHKLDRDAEVFYLDRDTVPPADPAKAAELEKLASQLRPALPVIAIEPVVIPAQPAPEPAPKPVKVDLFLDTRPPQDARSRRRRRTVARS